MVNIIVFPVCLTIAQILGKYTAAAHVYKSI